MLVSLEGAPTWRLHTVLGSVNLCNIFPQTFEVWEDLQAYNLKKCLIYFLLNRHEFRTENYYSTFICHTL